MTVALATCMESARNSLSATGRFKLRAPHQMSDSGTAEILLWQSLVRLWFAVAICALSILLRVSGLISGEWRYIALALGAYVAFVLIIRYVIQSRRAAGNYVLGATILADLMMIFGTTALVTEPAYYERTLFLSLCTIQFSQFYFGRGAAWLGVIGSLVGYLTLTSTANAQGAQLPWSQEFWAMVSFILASVAFMVIHGNFKERLAHIAALFERAEAGDFSVPFVPGPRSYPDAISHLGDSYNRVRVQLAEMVLTDPLSGCLNRRGFDQQLTRELARASRSGRPIALLAIDVDHFKLINDGYGHLTGDSVIREIGELLRESARASDLVSRMGGEEFMVLAPDTDAQGALQLGDRLCLAFRQHNFSGVEGMKITTSVGVVAEDIANEHFAADLRGRADEALYTAKQRGRDQVCFWTKGMRPFRNSPVSPMPKFEDSHESS